MNCKASRDAVGMFRDHIYVIGRKNSVDALIYYLRSLIVELEGKVNTTELTGSAHKSVLKTRFRTKVINEAIEEIKTIQRLKEDFYLEKYARIRQVHENEIMDKTFFKEYIKANRLTNLKQFQDA